MAFSSASLVRMSRVVRQRHSHGLGRTGHRVGGVHPAARALARADCPLDRVDLLAADQSTGARSDRLERVDDRDLAIADPARQDRTGVEEDGGDVESRRCHQHRRLGFVAAGQQDTAVEPFRSEDRLDRVGDDLPGDQRVVHSVVAHRDPVRDGDGPELHGKSAGGVHALLGSFRQPVQREVARGELVPRRPDADLRLLPVVIGHPDGSQHASCRRAFKTVGDLPRPGFEIDAGRSCGHSGPR
jgi:hypothetical protein